MATWTPITDIGWTGKIITTTLWNNQFGANGNMQYIKDLYARYYQSFAATVTVANNTQTQMATYTIPAGWGDGLYFMSMNVETAAASDLPIDTRRQVQISVGGVTSSNNYVSFATASGIKATYNIALYRRITVGTVINYNFYQLSATSTNFTVRASIQKVGV